MSAAKSTQKRITNFILAFVVAASTVTAVLPAASASAAPGLVYTSTSLSGLSFTPDRTEPSGGWSVSGDQLTMTIDNENASATSGFYRTEGVQAAIPANTSLVSSLYVDSDWVGKPVRAGMWGVGHSDTASDVTWPIIEFTTIGDGGFTGWRVFDTINGGWTNLSGVGYNFDEFNQVEITFNAATKEYDYYVNGAYALSLPAAWGSDVYGSFEAVIFNSFNSATGDEDDNYTVTWNTLQTGVAPMTTTCVDPTTVLTTDLSTWDLSETRATGHNELTEDGLHIYTEGATSTDKAAGYYATDFALADAGDETIAERMTFTPTDALVTDKTPGLQLVVDFDNDGIVDGILVGESVYGNDWWLTNSAAQFVKDGAPSHTGGYGSTNHGTLDQWLTSFPDAQVKAIGYSLGSGVYGDGTISRLSFGCVNYTFGLPEEEEPVVTTPTDTGTTTTTTTTTTTVVTPIITTPGSVLGDSDNGNTDGSTDVEGTTDDKTATTDTDGQSGIIFGLAWYWWLIILLGAGGLTWFLLAAYRRRGNEE